MENIYDILYESLAAVIERFDELEEDDELVEILGTIYDESCSLKANLTLVLDELREYESRRYMTCSNAGICEFPAEYVTRYFPTEKAARFDALMENWNMPYKLYIPIKDEEIGNYTYSEPIYLHTARDIRTSIDENNKEKFLKITSGFSNEEIEKICINAVEYGRYFKIVKKLDKYIISVNCNDEILTFESYSDIFDACVEARNVLNELFAKQKQLKK